MDYFQALVLAAIQGLTEFLPVSSSAHLILVPTFLGWDDQGLAFDVAVHVGTLLAVLIYFKRDLLKIVGSWFGGWSVLRWDQQGLLGWWIIVATIPVGLVGLSAGDWIELNLRSALVIACTTFAFGLALAWADRRASSNNGTLDTLNYKQALVVGAAQALALIPGTSRSGITMTAMWALGYSRTAAARFSFLLSIPAIMLPGLLKGVELSQKATPVAWDVLMIGIVVSAVVALLCIRVFMRFVERVGMMPFVYYRIGLALVILVFAWNTIG
jgi:undecaprenyl-diphosphatase